MSPKFRQILSNLLQHWLGRLLRPYNVLEFTERVEAVGSFLYETMPQLDPERFHEKLVILEGEVGINFFNLPSGDIPRFNYVILDQHLYFFVADIRSASWPEARSRGVSRPEWEAYQQDLTALQDEMPNLPYARDQQQRPVVMVIRWDDPVGPTSLHSRLTRLLRSRTE